MQNISYGSTFQFLKCQVEDFDTITDNIDTYSHTNKNGNVSERQSVYMIKSNTLCHMTIAMPPDDKSIKLSF